MPIYEYRCKECGEHVERRQTINEAPLVTCEKCGGTLEKQWSLSGFQFKGAGWYVTDYAAKKPGQETKKTADKSEKAAGGESTDSTNAASKVKSEPTPKKESGSKKE